MRRHKFTAEQIAEIESACKAAQDSQQAFRLGILCRHAQGDTYKDICKQAGISISAAEGIIRRYEQGAASMPYCPCAPGNASLQRNRLPR